MTRLIRILTVVQTSMVAGMLLSCPASAKAEQTPAISKSPAMVSISRSGSFESSVVIMTRRVAVKETGPKATVRKFGELYDWTPTYFAVRADVPTRLKIWNLQPDDIHTFELLGPHSRVLMLVSLQPLSKHSYVFTFHKTGLYKFVCTIHEPEMVGQIRVLPKAGGRADK